MNQNLKAACLGAMLFATAAFAQTLPATNYPDTDTASSSSPSAWVYVVSETTPTSGDYEIRAYQASSEGTLSSISGSPFHDDVNIIAVNGKYLFGAIGSGTNIDAYHMGSNGALSLWSSSQAFAPNCGEIGPMFMDHTGSTLYMWNYDGDSNCSTATWGAYSVDKANGKLTQIGTAGDNRYIPAYLTFTGNNEFAYGGADPIWGFKRNSDGTLTQLNINPATPAPPAGGYFYDGFLFAAADPTNHIVVSLIAIDNTDPSDIKYMPAQLAVYTADSSGNLTTTSTNSNMASVEVGFLNSMSMSPSGELLAVAGEKGLQIFHVNGANPLTKYTGLLTTDVANQVFWDNDNHLYAIFTSANKLRVYDVTPSSYSEPKGSPYTISTPTSLIVQTLPNS